MAFNNYMIYSVVSTTEKSKEDAQNKVNEIFQRLNNTEKFEDAKDYLQTDLGVKIPNLNHPINEQCLVNYELSDGILSIEVICNNEHSIYCYEK